MSSGRISLCMIVKNEERSLPSCLNSVRGAVDEVIVVDTGSTDQTVQLARQQGAIVIPFEWCDDFAAARNRGLEAATGDWILFLDADEMLDDKAREELPLWGAQEGVDGFFLQIHNYTGNGSGGVTINPVLRMFRNDPKHRFSGRIHEQIAESIVNHNPQAHFHMTDMIIHHYGYSEEIVLEKDKVSRNTRLLQQVIHEDPDNPFHRYNMGVEWLRIGRLEEALSSFRRAWEGLDPIKASYAHLVLKYEIRCLQALGRWEEAEAQITKGLQLYPDYTDLLHCRALTEEAFGREKQAEAALREALRLGPAPDLYHTEEGIGTYQTHYLLGLNAEKREALDEAVDCYVKAIRCKPSLTPPLYRIFRIMQAALQEEHIPELLKARFSFSTPESTWKVIHILKECGCYSSVIPMLHQLEQESPPHARKQIRVHRVEAMWKAGEWKQADRLRRKAHIPSSFSPSELMNWSMDIRSKEEAYQDPAIRLLQNKCSLSEALGGGAEQGAAARTTREEIPQLWSSFASLCQAAMNAERQELFSSVLEGWIEAVDQGLQEGELTSVSGVHMLLQTMISAADHHLAHMTTLQREQEHRGKDWRMIQRLRLTLPWSDGHQ
ncbi:glycosyltransferase [Paenibacillus urinalis]|uniref:Glycosyltransferase n=1 Tax=Paenibacillus urinalis TaxID=521520 RepID=A0AAX3MZC7_9BACL|nr:glycosyltransferase [Paenibacillus urinalis]WDH82486.1 glycosyltransferase [Paenibacillus urinalis]